jgi:hypothetical protein
LVERLVRNKIWRFGPILPSRGLTRTNPYFPGISSASTLELTGLILPPFYGTGVEAGVEAKFWSRCLGKPGFFDGR